MLVQAGGSGTDTATGLRKLGLSNSGRDGYLYVPESYKPGSPVPLIVTLHADSKGGLDGISHLYGFAKTNGVRLFHVDEAIVPAVMFILCLGQYLQSALVLRQLLVLAHHRPPDASCRRMSACTRTFQSQQIGVMGLLIAPQLLITRNMPACLQPTLILDR